MRDNSSTATNTRGSGCVWQPDKHVGFGVFAVQWDDNPSIYDRIPIDVDPRYERVTRR